MKDAAMLNALVFLIGCHLACVFPQAASAIFLGVAWISFFTTFNAWRNS